MKRVAALPGQRVCRTGLAITVDAVPMGEALDRDRRGNPLPVWQGCRVVAEGELFLMNWQVRDSLDGRLLGRFPPPPVIVAEPSPYTDEDGDGCFVHARHAVTARPYPTSPQSMEVTMSLIGQFSRTKSAIPDVRTLGLDAEVVLVPAEQSDAENAPDYRRPSRP